MFDLPDLTYNFLTSAIIDNDPERFKYTIETDPAYGKYHWTGHRNCKVSLSPSDAIKFGNNCPVCRKKLTKGVEQRVEELADRPVEYKSTDVPGFKHLLPLSEIISTVVGSESPATQACWKPYNQLVEKFGDEYRVLIDAPLDGLASVVDPAIAQAILRVRDGSAKVTPGYDGVYGQLVLGIEPIKVRIKTAAVAKVQQKSMSDFW